MNRFKLQSAQQHHQKAHFVHKVRAAETRTKIQLGGLVIKSGLTELLNIEIGEDLQQNSALLENVTRLLGGLIDAAQRLQESDTDDLIEHWRRLGEQEFYQDFLNRKKGV